MSNFALSAHAIFLEAKTASKTAVDASKDAILNTNEEQLNRYKAKEAVSFLRLMVALLLIYIEFQEGTAHARTAEQLKGDLDTEKNNLEMNRGANPGVIAQYEKRKQDVSREVRFHSHFLNIPRRSKLSLEQSTPEKRPPKRWSGPSRMLEYILNLRNDAFID